MPILKLPSERWVWAPQYLSAGTSRGPEGIGLGAGLGHAHAPRHRDFANDRDVAQWGEKLKRGLAFGRLALVTYDGSVSVSGVLGHISHDRGDIIHAEVGRLIAHSAGLSGLPFRNRRRISPGVQRAGGASRWRARNCGRNAFQEIRERCPSQSPLKNKNPARRIADRAQYSHMMHKIAGPLRVVNAISCV